MTRRRALGFGLTLGAALAAGPLDAAPTTAAPAPGRYEALLCVSTSEAAPNCGSAVAQLRPNGQLRVQFSDIVYRLKLHGSQVDVTLLHGAMQVDEFTADCAWADGTLRFRDDEKKVRYELRFPARGAPTP